MSYIFKAESENIYCIIYTNDVLNNIFSIIVKQLFKFKKIETRIELDQQQYFIWILDKMYCQPNLIIWNQKIKKQLLLFTN